MKLARQRGRAYRQAGFTLIELLVVIAIIGILASIILASLSTARSKGNDAKVESQMQSIQNAAEIFFDTNNSYDVSSTNSVCAPPTTDTSGLATLETAGNWPNTTKPTCAATATAYAMQEALSTSGEYWCVDSAGDSRQDATALGSNTVCP